MKAIFVITAPAGLRVVYLNLISTTEAIILIINIRIHIMSTCDASRLVRTGLILNEGLQIHVCKERVGNKLFMKV